MRCLVQRRDPILVKSYGFLSFADKMGKKIGKNITKNLSGKYNQKLYDMLSNLQQMHLKLLRKEELKKQQKQQLI